MIYFDKFDVAATYRLSKNLGLNKNDYITATFLLEIKISGVYNWHEHLATLGLSDVLEWAYQINLDHLKFNRHFLKSIFDLLILNRLPNGFCIALVMGQKIHDFFQHPT